MAKLRHLLAPTGSKRTLFFLLADLAAFTISIYGAFLLRFDGAATRTAGASGATISFDLHPDNASPSDLATDGTTFWVTDEGRDESDREPSARCALPLHPRGEAGLALRNLCLLHEQQGERRRDGHRHDQGREHP